MKTYSSEVTPLDLGIGPIAFIVLIGVLALISPKAYLKPIDRIAVQVGVVQGQANYSENKLQESVKQIEAKEEIKVEKPIKEAKSKEVIEPEVKPPEIEYPELLEPAQRGQMQGVNGSTYGVPHPYPAKPELSELPYSTVQAPLIILVDWKGRIIEAEFLDTTGDLGRDLLILNATRMLNFSETDEFKQLTLEEGQRVWLTFGITKEIDPEDLVLP